MCWIILCCILFLYTGIALSPWGIVGSRFRKKRQCTVDEILEHERKMFDQWLEDQCD